jgi:2-polyprenyl-6-methoxyphenol hydroxylase-like FAD-dependent oxidoreductase
MQVITRIRWTKENEAMTEVLIIGAGPTGLLLAAELARAGVGARVVDKAPRPVGESRAFGVVARTLEIFNDLGIVEEAIQRGRRLDSMNLYDGGRSLARFDMGRLNSPFPFILGLPQYETEALLRQLAEDLGVRVERPLALTELEQDPDGVTATLSRPDRETEKCRAEWVVGCDGAHSTVRREAGFSHAGPDLKSRFALLDARAELGLPNDGVHLFFHPEGALALFPLPQKDYWRVAADLPPGRELPDEPDLELFEQLIAGRTPLRARLSHPLWVTGFSPRKRKVDGYRKGRVLLAGDAAHTHSPVGAQGMNTGLGDAHNLGWKLALVARGEARDVLLDSYTAEREPVARGVLAGTQAATRLVTLSSPVSRRLRRRALGFLSGFGAVQSRGPRYLHQLHVNYRKSPIVEDKHPPLLPKNSHEEPGAEQPRLSERLAFRRGPRAGYLAPDAPVRQEGRATRLRQVLRGSRHSLLIFAGLSASGEDHARLRLAVEEVQRRFGNRVAVHVVFPGEEVPEIVGDHSSVLLDPGGACHRRYGARARCLYLVRPDEHVGFRAQPVDPKALVSHLDQIYRFANERVSTTQREARS